ncbi:hypothetical protein DE146DRAFT_515312 [Phaeosphaeria sp. MPI-PUGE-AT-0046c]|nr:hypothetical protein DE146DRAFT_515312 [Phaeosphaeria sp. MPI-PUGE-AT-0046c]
MARIEEQNKKIDEFIGGDQTDAIKIDRIARIRGWLRPEDDSLFYSAIQDYLSVGISLEEAAKRLCTPIEEKINAQRLDDVNFMDLWYSFIHSARLIHFRDDRKHKALVDLFVAFKEHSIPNNEKYNYLFQSLSDFSMACREAYNDAPTPGTSFALESTSWANMNYFYAMLTGRQVSDKSLFGLWAMRQALETPHADDPQSTAVQKYDTYVPAAAVWAFGAFKVLANKQEDLTPKDNKHGNPAKGGELWKGKAEFSYERWSFWKERFAEIGKMDDVSGDARNLARDAVESMERAATFELI